MRAWGLTPPQWRELPEEDREEMLEEYLQVCPSCGNLRSVCSDPERVWYPQREMCYPTAQLAVVARRLRDGHKPPGWDAHPLDGLIPYVSEVDVNPDDDFVPARPAKR